jgi:hypothetical protein
VSNHARAYDKTLALLKSVAAPCDVSSKNPEHSWRKCRHCLAIAELDDQDVRVALKAFIEAVEAGDRNYGRVLSEE